MGDFFSANHFEAGGSQAQQPQAQDNPDRAGNHVHVSLSQIVAYTRKEEGLVIHRQKVQNIITIGRVLTVDEVTTKNVYMLDDYTLNSQVEVQLWKNSPDGESLYIPPPPVMEQTFIRVIGQPRYDEKKPFILGFCIQPITNPNEIVTHMLEIVQDALILEKRMKHSLNTGPADGGQLDTSVTVAYDQNKTATMSGFNQIQREILNVLNKYGTDDQAGMKREDIKLHLRSVNGKVIDEALAFLSNEGHIFSTIDDDTFKSTETN